MSKQGWLSRQSVETLQSACCAPVVVVLAQQLLVHLQSMQAKAYADVLIHILLGDRCSNQLA
jgi:hypothetical protein